MNARAMTARPVTSEPALAPFDNDERALVTAALALIDSKLPEDATLLREHIKQLATLHSLLRNSPSLRNARSLGQKQRNETTLMEHLTHIDGLSGDLELPFKATLSRTFLLSKIQFFRGLVLCTSSLRGDNVDVGVLSHLIREEFAQSIYTLLAEELLLALLRKRDVCDSTKQRAADQLITIWDNAEMEIDDFCPLLESAWHARNRVSSGLGCLMGTTEYFRLVSEDCGPQFLDFFARDEVSEGEQQAFREFLFNMTYEEIETLRDTMRQQGIDVISQQKAVEILGRPMETLDPAGEIDPTALYRSYYRRQLAADFRIMAGSKGPRRTAEAYLMVYLLDQQ